MRPRLGPWNNYHEFMFKGICLLNNFVFPERNSWLNPCMFKSFPCQTPLLLVNQKSLLHVFMFKRRSILNPFMFKGISLLNLFIFLEPKSLLNPFIFKCLTTSFYFPRAEFLTEALHVQKDVHTKPFDLWTALLNRFIFVEQTSLQHPFSFKGRSLLNPFLFLEQNSWLNLSFS